MAGDCRSFSLLAKPKRKAVCLNSFNAVCSIAILDFDGPQATHVLKYCKHECPAKYHLSQFDGFLAHRLALHPSVQSRLDFEHLKKMCVTQPQYSLKSQMHEPTIAFTFSIYRRTLCRLSIPRRTNFYTAMCFFNMHESCHAQRSPVFGLQYKRQHRAGFCKSRRLSISAVICSGLGTRVYQRL